MSPQDEGQTQKKTNAHQKEEGDFEPGAHTKELLFGTRKRKRIWGGVEFSGLFSNENIAGDSNWFWFAMLLESAGLIALCYALWEETTLSVPFVIIIGLVVIFFDIVFAWIHHFVLTPKKCEIENEKLRIFPDMRKAEEQGKSYYDYIRLHHLQIPFNTLPSIILYCGIYSSDKDRFLHRIPPLYSQL